MSNNNNCSGKNFCLVGDIYIRNIPQKSWIRYIEKDNVEVNTFMI